VLRVVTVPAGAPFRLFAGAVENPKAAPVGHGTTPASISGLTPGPYRIFFGGEGWPARPMAVEVAERGVSPVELTFPHGTVKVMSIPPGAEIFESEESLGTAPLELPLIAGTHTLTAEYKDRTSRPRRITIIEGGTETVRFDFSTSSETTARQPRRVKKKKTEESAFIKIGRSITNFFTDHKKK
jgi:PEGA domain